MKSIAFALAFLIALAHAHASAGQEGNGGDGILCGSTVTMFDLFEGSEIHKFKLDLGGPGLTPDQKVDLALSRLARLDRARSQKLQALAAAFWANAELTNDDLIDVPDAGLARMPAGCTLKQIAVQGEPIFPNAKLYTVDAKLWRLMNNDSKASLILHEIILNSVRADTPYRSFHADTRRVRYYNAWLTSTRAQSDTLGAYASIENLSALRGSLTYHDLPMGWNQQSNAGPFERAPEFYDASGTELKSGWLLEVSTVAFRVATLSFSITTDGRVLFHPNGKIKLIEHPDLADFSTHPDYQIPVLSGTLIWPAAKSGPTFDPEKFEFDDTENVTSMHSTGSFKNTFVESKGDFELARVGQSYYVKSVTEGTLTFNSQTYEIGRYDRVGLFETGEPQDIAGIAILFKTSLGQVESSNVELYRSGALKTMRSSNHEKDFEVTIDGVAVTLQSKNRISFFENGAIFSAVSANDVNGLKSPAGAAVTVHAHERFNLDPNSRVTCTGRSCL